MVKTRNGLTMFYAWRDLRGGLVCEPTVTCSLTSAQASMPPAGHMIQPLTVATFANTSNMSLPHGILELTARTLTASPPINVTKPGALIIVRQLEFVIRVSWKARQP
jgi:hypothetical protein